MSTTTQSSPGPVTVPKSAIVCYIVSISIMLLAVVAIPWCLGGHYPLTVRTFGFAAVLVSLLALFLALGEHISDQAALGVLLSGRNTYSLSRLQVVLWTWLIISALIAAVSARAWGLGGGGLATAMDIEINEDLFAVMGISLGTAAAVPSLLSLKAQAGADPQQVQAAQVRMVTPIGARGHLLVRPTGASALLRDLVQGDDLATAGIIDISKVQQLLITVLLVAGYAAMLFDLFLRSGEIAAMPPFNGYFLTLLAVSHTGYLIYKAAPRTAPTSGADAQPPAAPVVAPPSRPAPPSDPRTVQG
jgi:hypothetical protein